MYVKIGMTPRRRSKAQPSTARTYWAGRIRIGTIEPGKWADIIAVKSDPLQDISALENVSFVMKSGVVYKNE